VKEKEAKKIAQEEKQKRLEELRMEAELSGLSVPSGGSLEQVIGICHASDSSLNLHRKLKRWRRHSSRNAARRF
jgi:hypothetical protein